MSISFDNIAIFSTGGAVGYLVRTLIDHRLAKNRAEEDRRAKEFMGAAVKFRSAIINELVGFYPVNQYWDKTEFYRLYQSLPKIKSAAADFSFFIESKTALDDAVKDYDEYCRKTTWEHVSASIMYPDMRKDGEISPCDKFEHLVNKLLSFAEKK